MILDEKSLVKGNVIGSKRIFLKTPLPTLNEYTLASRANKFASSAMKKRAETSVMWELKQQLRDWHTDKPVFLIFRWVEKNKRRDHDNVAFAKKFVQDAMVSAGVIQGDGWKHVLGFVDLFSIDKDNPGVYVDILEVVDDEQQ